MIEKKVRQFSKKILNLTIKKKWFDLIKSGVKTEQYRDITEYWLMRLAKFNNETEPQTIDEILTLLRAPDKSFESVYRLVEFYKMEFKKFDYICFKNGYQKDSPTICVRLKNIQVGKKEGTNKYYFVLKLGEVL